ncbi:hypothetical protein [Tautonia marina]|uniref:hypothetical protein n=1 Tax=Tautonia marina TaxID=2653855 RepID=UPI001260821B|nr:hypothetical protein [Tautonia marina]
MRGHIITWERAAKGDLHITQDAAGFMSRASVIDNSIISRLHEKRILGWKHIEAAATYSLWQHAFKRPFYAEPRKLYMIEIAGGQSNGKKDEGSYRKLLRRLTRLDQYIVDTAITGDYVEPVTEQEVIRQAHTNKQVVHAFDLLCEAIRQVKEEIERDEDNACATDN